MKYWAGVIAVTVLCLLLLDRCYAAECWASAHAVLASGARHATWNYIDHKKCWRSGDPSAHASRDRRMPPQAFVPVPPLRYDRLTPAEGRALSRYLLGE